MLVCFPIITQEPLDRFASNFNASRETHENVLNFEILESLLLTGKIANIIIYDHTRVSGRTNYDLTTLGTQASYLIK